MRCISGQPAVEGGSPFCYYEGDFQGPEQSLADKIWSIFVMTELESTDNKYLAALLEWAVSSVGRARRSQR